MAVEPTLADAATPTPVPPTTAPTVASTVQHQVEFHWEHVGADWHLLIYAFAAILFAWLARRHYGPGPAGWAGRIARGCRVAVIMLLVAMIAGPSWRDTSITSIPGRLLVAVDRSASMDRDDGPNGTPRIALTKGLAQALDRLAAERNLLIEWRSVGGIDEALSGTDLLSTVPTTPGGVSPLGDELLRLADPGRCDLLVLLSDGRVTAGAPLSAVAEHLRDREIGLSVLEVGGTTMDPALWVDQLVVNRSAALGEREPVLVRLTGRALDADTPVTVKVTVDGKPIGDATAVVTADHGTTIELSSATSAEFVKEGEAVLRVEAQQGDLVAVREARITVTERRLQVLILDSRPRYELRYLREALRRDHTIELHAYLGTAREWGRWSDRGPVDHLPLSTIEIRDYDVIVMGDVRPDQFTDDQLQAIESAVRKNGTGLIWLLGETGGAAAFTKHPLGDLLPTRLPTADAIAAGFSDQHPRHPHRTEAAEAIGLFDPGEVDWDVLPPLIGAAPLGELRPATETLMVDDNDQPLVCARNYPPGRAIVLAVDDTWRWRRNVGDTYLQRFHGQLLRYASGGRRLGRHLWRLTATPRRVIPGESVTLTLAPIGPPPENAPSRVVAALVGPDGREVVAPLSSADGGFTTTVIAPEAGNWRLRLVDGAEERLVDAGELEIQPPGAELRDPRADPEALAELARGTGGQIYTDPEKLVAELPDVARDRVESLPPRGLWDTPWAFALLVLLVGVEWAIRRLHRLP